MKDDENNLLSVSEKIIKNYKNYYKKLLNNTNCQNYHYLTYEQIIKDTVKTEVMELIWKKLNKS